MTLGFPYQRGHFLMIHRTDACKANRFHIRKKAILSDNILKQPKKKSPEYKFNHKFFNREKFDEYLCKV